MTKTVFIDPVSRRYASSLADAAFEEKALDKVLSDINDLCAMLQSSEQLQYALTSGIANDQEDQKLAEEISKKAKFHKLTTNFLKLLAQNDRLILIIPVVQASQEEIEKRQNIVPVEIKTAFSLKKAQQAELSKTLENQLGKKVHLFIEEDKSLIGGVSITVNSKQLNFSVASDLNRMAQYLTPSNTVKEVA